MVLLSSVVFILLFGAALLAPGWILGRLLGTPMDLCAAFLGSAGLFLNLLIVLDAFSISLTVGHISLGLIVLCTSLATATKFCAVRVKTIPNVASYAEKFRWHRQHWFLLSAILGIVAIAGNAALNPLSGSDTIFRWDFLARQMLRENSIQFYPPITANDFLHYGWCDGIAPLISSLYFWSYLSFGEANDWAVFPVIIVQAVLLFVAVHQLATLRGGTIAGWAAVAVLITSPILLWGVANGQETGLTALSLVAMFLFIERDRTLPHARWLIWAGIAAGTGALAREYGLGFIALGSCALILNRTSRRGWVEFVLSFVLVTFPWYLRNWIKTGNPLYSHDLGGLFPVNPIQAEYMRSVRVVFGFSAAPSAWRMIATYTAALAAPAILLGLIGGMVYRRAVLPWILAIVLTVGVWLWSINQTSGGYVYSLRVLTPAISLGAVISGILLAKWTAVPRWLLALLLLALGVDASERSFFLPNNAFVPWWHVTPPIWSWPRLSTGLREYDPMWGRIVDAAEWRQILTTDPHQYAMVTGADGHALCYFSPAVQFLFAPETNFNDSVSQLRAMTVRFVILSKNRPVNDRVLAAHSFFRTLQSTPPALETQYYAVYDLYQPAEVNVAPKR